MPNYRIHEFKKVITFSKLRDVCFDRCTDDVCGNTGLKCTNDEVTMRICPVWNKELENLIIFKHFNSRYEKYNPFRPNGDANGEKRNEEVSGHPKKFTDAV